MDWAALQLRRFEYSFPDLPAVPTADPPPVKPHPSTPPPRCSLDVVCYGVSTEQLLCLTHSSHPSFSSHCYTGLQTYSGAEVLARLLLRRPQVLQRGRAVLEMGCGIGLTGVAAAHCMNQQSPLTADALPPLLLLTDGEEDAVRLTRCNVAINLLSSQPQRPTVDESTALHFLQSTLATSTQLVPPPVSSPSSSSASLSVHALSARWDAAGVSVVQSYCGRALSRPARFDVVYGTDLFYSRTAVDAILDFALPLLSDSGVLLLAHTPRLAELHATLRSACQRRSLTIRYVQPSAFLTKAEELDRGWTQVEVVLIAASRAWEALQQSADWRWAAFDAVGQVERQQAEEERRDADDSLVLSMLAVSAEDL